MSGASLNCESLSQFYGALEQRVIEKTQDLARSNHSLELLYRTSRTFNETPVSKRLLREVLRQIARELGTGPATLCLCDEGAPGLGTVLVTTRPQGKEVHSCWNDGCRACRDVAQPGSFDFMLPDGWRSTVLSFPVSHQDQRFGVLLVELPADAVPEPLQHRLLGTLAEHIGTALNLQRRMREGINSAYRQLRELLTTFRLKMDDRGLARALEATVDEFRARGAADITLDNALPSALFGPNEELHVLQIVREGLSNVVRHAPASPAVTDVEVDSVIVIDDHPLFREGVADLIAMELSLRLVGEAPNGESGVRLAMETDPGLILLDLNMKGMDGLETLRRLREADLDARADGYLLQGHGTRAGRPRARARGWHAQGSGQANTEEAEAQDAGRGCGMGGERAALTDAPDPVVLCPWRAERYSPASDRRDRVSPCRAPAWRPLGHRGAAPLAITNALAMGREARGR